MARASEREYRYYRPSTDPEMAREIELKAARKRIAELEAREIAAQRAARVAINLLERYAAERGGKQR